MLHRELGKEIREAKKEFDCARRKLFSDLQLVLVAQAMEYELLVDTGEDCSSTDRPRSGRLFHLG